jgi:hypothetical protein
MELMFSLLGRLLVRSLLEEARERFAPCTADVWLIMRIVDASIEDVVSTVSYFFSLTCRYYYNKLTQFAHLREVKTIDDKNKSIFAYSSGRPTFL